MSGLAYHAGHYTKGAVGAIGRHNWQKRGERDEHSNQDIDPNRSGDNMLLLVPEQGLYQAAKERIEAACTGRVTKASNWITETIVYPPEDVLERNDPQEIGSYFEDVLEWHRVEFGKDNVLASVVHMDETTPHLHTDLVPMTKDGRLSSKEVFARKNLNRHHTELAAFLQGRGWDIQRGESTLEKQVRAKTIPEYKKAAEAEKTALVAEIEPLRTKKRDIERIEDSGFKIPIIKKTIIDSSEYARVKDQAVGFVASVENITHIAEERQRIDEESKALDDRKMVIERELNDLWKKQREYRERMKDLEERERIAKQLPEANAYLQGKLHQANAENTALKGKIEALERSFDQRVQERVQEAVKPLQGTIEWLTEQLAKVCETLMNIVKASGMFLHSKKGEYRIEGLTDKQSKLIDAFCTIGAKAVEAAGHREMADDMRKHVSISKDLDAVINPPVPARTAPKRDGQVR